MGWKGCSEEVKEQVRYLVIAYTDDDEVSEVLLYLLRLVFPVIT